jgi:hypothetical protein
MAAKTRGERPDRFEKTIQILADGQVSLQKLIADFAIETQRGFDRVQRRFETTDRRIQRRNKRLDERIDKLVIAIGESIRQPIPATQQR